MKMKVSNPQGAATREGALSLHKSGGIAAAARIYAALLAEDPDNADILGLMGLAQYQLGKRDGAKQTWLKSLSQQAEAPVTLRNMNNLLAALLEEEKPEGLSIFGDLAIPDWPAGLIPSQDERSMAISLARGLLHAGHKSAALKLLESILPLLADDALSIKAGAEVMLDAGQAERASAVLLPLTAAVGQGNGTLLISHAAAAWAAGHRDDAMALSARAVEAIPVCITAKSANQGLLIGVLNKAPKLVTKPLSAEGFHFSENSPASLAKKFNDEFRFLSIFPEATTAAAALESQPRPDLVLNNWVNAETLSRPGSLQFISDFADGLGLPVLNHPRKAAETTRQRNAERLAGIPGLVVPRVVRFITEAAARKAAGRLIRDTFGFPVIIRNPFTQMGRETAKLDTPRQLEKHLSQMPDQELYGIEYIHNPAADGIYRKIRAAVIGEEIFVAHVHFGGQWNVHREKDEAKRAALVLERAALRFADKIISNPLQALGKPGMAALKEIRARIGLEFFGIDFDLMPDGRLLFFEANAALNISLSDREGVEATRAKMRDALRRLFRKTCGR